MSILLQRVLSCLALIVAAGAATADAAQDCRDEALTPEEREAACKTAAGEAEAYKQLAFTHLHADHPQEALVAARRAVEIATSITLDSPEEAQAVTHDIVNLGPEYEDTQGLLLQAMAETGSGDEAVAAYQEAQAAGVEDRAGFLAGNLAWGLYKAGEHDKALPVIEKWLAAHPEPMGDSEYYIILDTAAHVMAAEGETDKAVDTFLRAAEIGGTGQRVLYKSQLTSLGFAPGDDDAGFEAALRACVATGEACRLY